LTINQINLPENNPKLDTYDHLQIQKYSWLKPALRSGEDRGRGRREGGR